MPIRVAVADDNVIVREGVAQLLASTPEVEVVATCGDGDDLLRAVDEHEPDVVVTDIRMPPDPDRRGDPRRRVAARAPRRRSAWWC